MSFYKPISSFVAPIRQFIGEKSIRHDSIKSFRIQEIWDAYCIAKDALPELNGQLDRPGHLVGELKTERLVTAI